MFRHLRPVRFAEVDAAGIVFFARHLEFCHDALEALFADLDGGYPGLVVGRGLGIPSVRVEVDYRAPLRYGDVAVIDVEVVRVGRTSVTFRHTMRRARDGVECAAVTQVVVLARLDAMGSVPIPDDVRALLERHLVTPSGAPTSGRGA